MTRTPHTGGPHRIQGKAGLVTGCDYRPCDTCHERVFVPQSSPWRRCTPCRRGWK